MSVITAQKRPTATAPRPRAPRVPRATAFYHFDILSYKWYQNVLIVSRNTFIYGFDYFWDVSGPLLLKFGILGPIWGSKMPSFNVCTSTRTNTAQHGFMFLEVISHTS